jgi:hypothetical protein
MKIFHVHVDMSSIALGAVLFKLTEGNIYHPFYFDNRNLFDSENNYTTIGYECLSTVYSLQKFHHYLLGTPFKFFTDHSKLKYLVNKIGLEGRIYRWLLFFQEFESEVVVKPKKHNVRMDHLSRIVSGEASCNLDNKILDAQIFRVEAFPNKLVEIVEFLIVGQALTN